MNTLTPIIALAALGLAALPATAATAHHRHHYRHHTVYRHQSIPERARGAYAYEPQVACTVVGCQPVPRGCHPEMGYSFDGTPTGLDVAVCGNTTYYGNRR